MLFISVMYAFKRFILVLCWFSIGFIQVIIGFLSDVIGFVYVLTGFIQVFICCK